VLGRRQTAASAFFLHGLTVAALLLVWASARSGTFVRYQAPPRPAMHANYYTFHEMSVRLDEGGRFGNINLARVSRRPFDRPYEPYDISTPAGSTFCDYYTLDAGFGLIVHLARKMFPALSDTFLRTLALQAVIDALALLLIYGTFAGWSWLTGVVASLLYALNPVFGYVVAVAFYYFWDGLIVVIALSALVWAARLHRRATVRPAAVVMLVALGAAMGLGVLLRANWSTYAAVVFGSMLLTRHLRSRVWIAALAFVIAAAPAYYRASRAERRPATSTRMLWHTAHQALGRDPNPFGIEDNDEYQFHLAKAEYGVDYNYCSYRKQDEAMRDRYRRLWAADPAFIVRSVTTRINGNVLGNAAAPSRFYRFWNVWMLGLAWFGGVWLVIRGGERRNVALASALLFGVACAAIGVVYYVNGNYASVTQFCLLVLAVGVADFAAVFWPVRSADFARHVRRKGKAVGRLVLAHRTVVSGAVIATVVVVLVLSLPIVQNFLTPPRPAEVWEPPRALTGEDVAAIQQMCLTLPGPTRDALIGAIRASDPAVQALPPEEALAQHALRHWTVIRSLDSATGKQRQRVVLPRPAADAAFSAMSKSASYILGWRTASVVGIDLETPASWSGRSVRVRLDNTGIIDHTRVLQLTRDKFARAGFAELPANGDERLFELKKPL
jgi:hypothetical protein